MRILSLIFLLLLSTGLPIKAKAQKSFQTQSYRVYPNPTHDGNFEISFSSAQQQEKIMIVVRNLVGKPVYQKSLPWQKAIKQAISIGRLPKGIYLIEIKSGEEKLIRKVSYL